MMGKTLQELTIADNFMFGAVMTLPDNCRRMLELSLDISVGSVEINTEKSFLYHPEYKGVRLDVYAKDENNTHYDVEMQVAKKEALAKRTRYYHSQMDMELLVKGNDYSELPKACVIFICDFDPFEEKKYRYTFQGRCDEKEELLLGDERFTIFLSTKGENTDEVSQELIAFLDYVKANLAESTQEFNDNYVRQLQDSVKQVKMSREMGVRYMQLQELLRETPGSDPIKILQSKIKLLKINNLQTILRKGTVLTVLFRCVDHGTENRYLSDEGCHRGWISVLNFL